MFSELNNSRKFRSGYFLLLFLTSALLFGGCGVWRDFTTYFNIYYNAKDLFKEAERQIAEQRKNPYESFDVPPPANANGNLTKVIEKCSKILQFNKESSFVDKSLLMIGKSFYYQQNYIKALRKFQELTSTMQNSSLIPEARLWIGKTEMAMKNFASAEKILNEVRKVAKENGDDEIIVETLIEETRYALDQKEYEKAITLLNEVLSVSGDNSIRAITSYQMGLLYYEKSDFTKAAAAFKGVHNYSPSFELQLDASLQFAKSLRALKDYTNALETLADLRSEAKYSDSYDRIDLENGITRMAMGEKEAALKYLTEVDTAYKTTISAGNAKFEIGKLYETEFFNYDSAYKYYQAALSATVSAEYLPLIRNRSQLFTRYFQYNTALRNAQTQLRYVDSPSVFIADSLAYYGDTSKVAGKTDNNAFSDDEFKSRKQSDGENNERGRDRERERERDGGDNERSRERDRDGGVRNTLPTNASGTAQINKGPAPVRPALTRDSLHYLASKSSLDLGNIFFLELNRPDSALFHYNRATVQYKSTYTEAQALFALGSYYLSNNNKTTADSLFNYIYDNFKKDKVVNSAADKINKPRIDLSLDPAKDKFIAVEKLFRDTTRYKFVLNELYTIADSFPTSGYAPKALHAAGMLLEDKLKLYDSAAAVYDSLAKKFPYSENTQKVAGKLSSYKEEKARLAKIISDSLDAIRNKKIQDSIAISRKDSIEKASKDSLKIAPKETVSDSSAVKKLPPMLTPDINKEPEQKKEDPNKEEPKKEDPKKEIPPQEDPKNENPNATNPQLPTPPQHSLLLRDSIPIENNRVITAAKCFKGTT